MAKGYAFALDAPVRDEDEWKKWRDEIAGRPEFTPLEIKGAYLMGVIYQVCENVELLIECGPWPVGYISAYGVFTSGIELLGRCITGDPDYHRSNLNRGLNQLIDPTPPMALNNIVIRRGTGGIEYTVEDLTNLRNFAAHGQATTAKRYD